MNLQCAYLHLAIVSPPPAKPIADTSPKTANKTADKAANDNYPAWPLLPFPAGWHASN